MNSQELRREIEKINDELALIGKSEFSPIARFDFKEYANRVMVSSTVIFHAADFEAALAAIREHANGFRELLADTETQVRAAGTNH